ncbi:TonB-dependent receptor [Compostibacter hankyongensis]|uniref:TonB-dependent receptor n=2 Tax=Compostibacter hankyongensis TaxID=1007089 RepID=A0ABP8G170_9BACT
MAFFLLLLPAAGLLYRKACSAQDTTGHRLLRDTALRAVEVAAQRQAASFSASSPVQLLDSAQLSALGARSVAGAARYFAGVLVKDYGGIGGLKTVSVRSLGAAHTGVLYDGLPLSDAQNGQIDLGRLTTDNLSQLTLYNAQPPDMLQPAAAYSMATVLSLTTRRPAFAKGHSLKGEAALEGGAFGLLQPSATLQYGWSPRGYSTLSAGWQQAEGKYPFTLQNGDSLQKKHRENSDIQALRLEYDTRYRFSDSSETALKAYFYNARRGLPGAVILYNDRSRQRLDDRDFFIQAGWRKRFSPQSRLQVSGKYEASYKRYLDPDFLNSEGHMENRYRQKTYYLSGTWSYRLRPFLTLAYGSDIMANTLDASLPDFVYPTRFTWLNNLAAAFSWQRLDIRANMLGTLTGDRVKTGPQPQTRKVLSPAAALSWQPRERLPLRLRFFYKSIFRMPTFNDLYYTLIGNTRLRPEFTRQYDMGLSWNPQLQGLLSSLAFTADAYYNTVRDKIIAVPRQNLFQWTMLNAGRVHAKGVDAGARLFFRPLHAFRLTLGGHYSFQEARDVTDPSAPEYGQQLPYTPKHSGALQATIQYKPLTLGYNLLFSGSRYRMGDPIDYNRLPAFVTQDLTLTGRLPAGRGGMWELTAAVDNLFNRQYEIVRYYPMPGRSWRLGLHYRF